MSISMYILITFMALVGLISIIGCLIAGIKLWRIDHSTWFVLAFMVLYILWFILNVLYIIYS